MTFDVFAAIRHGGNAYAVHNVRLVDAGPADRGMTILIVEHGGVQTQLHSDIKYHEEWSRRDVGLVGYVKPATPGDEKFGMNAAFHFRAYLDQSLRRVPEIDVTGDGRHLEPWKRPVTVGWVCDAKPTGFHAPIGIVPGERGNFLRDDTVPVTLHVPPEFIRQCALVQMSPEDVLRSFVGDLAGIQNLSTCPRADGYGSNGSDERNNAEAWLDRAHGMYAISESALYAREAANEESLVLNEDWTALLDDYRDFGGNPDELINAVQALVDAQESKAT